MIHATDAIREHLLAAIGYPHGHPPVADLDALRASQWSSRFERLMRNRLVMGAFRYGPLGSQKAVYDQIESIRRHAAAYEVSGNTEHLVDIANLALVEFVECGHPRAHFRAVDDGEHTPRRTGEADATEE